MSAPRPAVVTTALHGVVLPAGQMARARQAQGRRIARLRRIVRLWPGAYFTLPTRPVSLREVNWLLRDHYLPLLFARSDR